MTTFATEPANATDYAKKMLLSKEKDVTDLFSKIIKSNDLDTKIELRLCNGFPKRNNNVIVDPKDFPEQMAYHRNLKGYSQLKVAKALGIERNTYMKYERKQVELTDLDMINKIIKYLGIKEKPKVSEYVRFLMSNPEKQLKKYLKKNHLSNRKFCKLSGVSRRSMYSWYNEGKTISKESFYKIKEFVEKYEEGKNNFIKSEEEEIEI